jgi:SWI/SNF-related matrix-associated actin-dependent regulator 1 of chromatin subfamily A
MAPVQTVQIAMALPPAAGDAGGEGGGGGGGGGDDEAGGDISNNSKDSSKNSNENSNGADAARDGNGTSGAAGPTSADSNPHASADAAAAPNAAAASSADSAEPQQPPPGPRRAVSRIQRLVAPFFLRRLKEDVLAELPPKTMQTILVDMSTRQRDVYVGMVSAWKRDGLALAQAVEQAKLKAAADKGSFAGGSEQQFEDFARVAATSQAAEAVAARKQASHMFSALRKAANDPLLLHLSYPPHTMTRIATVLEKAKHFGPSAHRQLIMDELASMSDYAIHGICCDYPELEDLALPHDERCNPSAISGKMQKLIELLADLTRQGRRALVFSQFTTVLDIIEGYLEPLYSLSRLTGATPMAERQRLIDDFNRDGSETSVFLLTTRAGGLGINLAGADTVIIFDSDWNPQVDRQAENRAHRLGQTRPVTVIRLVTKETVDEHVVMVAGRKAALERAVLKYNVTDFQDDEKFEILSVMGAMLRS